MIRQRVQLQYLADVDVLCTKDTVSGIAYPAADWGETRLLCSGPAQVHVFPGTNGYDVIAGDMCYPEPARFEEVVQYLRGTRDSGTREILRIRADEDNSYYAYGVPKRNRIWLLFIRDQAPVEVQFTRAFLQTHTIKTTTVNEAILQLAFPRIHDVVRTLTNRYYPCPYFQQDGYNGFDGLTGCIVDSLAEEWIKIDSPVVDNQLLQLALDDGVFDMYLLQGTPVRCTVMRMSHLRYLEHFANGSLLEVMGQASAINFAAVDTIGKLIDQGKLHYREEGYDAASDDS